MDKSSNPVVSIIAAIGKNNALGKDNKLLWHIPEDFRWFKKHTTGHPVIMGRKTYESIGKALPNRTNIIISTQKNYSAPGCLVVPSLDRAIADASKLDSSEVFIIGGASIYKQSMAYCERLYLTIINREYDADSFFPAYSEFSEQKFKKETVSNDLQISFYILEKPRS